MADHLDISRTPQDDMARGIERFSPGLIVLVCVVMVLSPAFLSAETPGPLDFVINEVLADPADTLVGDANGDGTRDSGDDQFIEIVNVSGIVLDLEGVTINDLDNIRHAFPAGTLVPPGCAVVVFGGGSPTGSFGGALVQTSTSGALSFTKSGDTISVLNGGTVIDSMTFPTHGCEGNQNQSITLDPDLTGTCALHILASGGALFSPGTRIDGSPFGSCAIQIFSDDFESGGTTNWSSTLE